MSVTVDDLVARAKRGDRGALEALLERHLATVYRFVTVKLGSGHPAVDDVVQETLIGALTSVHRLRAETDAAAAAWLIGIARFKLADHLRDKYFRPSESLDQPSPLPSAEPSPDDVVMDAARDQVLREALSHLTSEQEEVLTLKYILGFDNQAVAEMTGRTVGAVKALQHRALASLARLLALERTTWN